MSSSIVSVFGSSRPVPGSDDYQQAYTIGRLLAEAGVAVATGGYMGTMEAVSKGAHDVGGRVIGVTSTQIEKFRPLGPNPYLKEETRFETLRERLLHLVVDNDGMIGLPGGIGTLAEVATAWNGMQTGEIEIRPFVLVGALWQRTMNSFIDTAFIRPLDSELLHFAATPEAAVTYILDRLPR